MPAFNYRPEVKPLFTSTPTFFFVTLYNVPIEKVAIEDEKVAIERKNLLIGVAIDGLNANKNTRENAKNCLHI